MVISLNLGEKNLYQLHNCHLGMSRMKALVSCIWRPNKDRTIEEIVNNSQERQLNANSPTKVPIHSCRRNDKPWVRLHLELCKAIR